MPQLRQPQFVILGLALGFSRDTQASFERLLLDLYKSDLVMATSTCTVIFRDHIQVDMNARRTRRQLMQFQQAPTSVPYTLEFAQGPQRFPRVLLHT